MSKNNTLDNMIATEKAKLSKYEEKQNELTKKIKTCKANIEKYKLMKNNEQLNKFTSVLEGKGISMEDVVAALAAGDLLSLQEKMENANEREQESENATSYDLNNSSFDED